MASMLVTPPPPRPKLVNVRVLVAFATRAGSTKEIAERIGAKLSRHVAHVDVRPVSEVCDAQTYDAVIVGSAIHDQAWLPEAEAFVRDNADVLVNRPVWLFSAGAQGALRGPIGRRLKRSVPPRIAALCAFLQPRGYRLFAGVVARVPMPLFARLAFHAVGGRFGDLRDWDAIEAWGDGIGRTIASSVPERL